MGSTHHGELVSHKEGNLISRLRTFRVRIEEHEQRLEDEPDGIDIAGALLTQSAVSILAAALLAQPVPAEG